MTLYRTTLYQYTIAEPRSASDAYHCCLPKLTAGLEEIFQNYGIGQKKTKKTKFMIETGASQTWDKHLPQFRP